ncbi:hypothetical protein Tco_1212994 [Tanacetum coccineum]
MAAALKHIASNFAKLEKFDGVDFRRWQKKIYFWLSSMSVVYVLTTLMPEDGGDNPTVEQARKRAKWDNDDYICRVVNMVEHNNSSRNNDNKGKRKHHKTKADPNKKPKDDDDAWWVDSGATVHVCKDRCWFKTYKSLNGGSILHMGNKSTALVHGRGYVDLRPKEAQELQRCRIASLAIRVTQFDLTAKIKHPMIGRIQGTRSKASKERVKTQNLHLAPINRGLTPHSQGS